MKISLNEIKKYVNIPISDDELITLIGSRLVEIEEVIDLAPKYQGIYIVKVATCEPIEGTHLHLCQIDAGADLVQVVCGAPNVHAGMLAVWIAPGAIVPETYGNENFRLSVRKLQGYESNGMLAAIDELDLGTDHEGIAEIDPRTLVAMDGSSETRPVQPGDSFADVFELNDIILDVENKSLTHRPDCFGLVGFAREVAGILGQPFTEPEWIGDLNSAKGGVREAFKACAVAGEAGSCSKEHKDLARAARSVSEGHAASSPATIPQVKIADTSLCPRYSCAVFDLGDNTPSKYLTKNAVFLAKAGMRAIDPMVDLTNTIMLQTGQPLHAFDYDKFISVGGTKSPQIIVRSAKDGEPLQLIDGKTVECTPDDILITSNNVPVALAGAMGGKNTEIDASTKRVVLESATFSLYHLRKTQMAHGIFSEAITRFTKGQPAPMTLPVLIETVRSLGVEPLAIIDEYPGKEPKNVVKITTSAINNLLGTNYSPETIYTTLENVGFEVAGGVREAFEVTSPAWRTDIHTREDVIEEVGRLLGFDNITLDLPKRPFSGTEIAPMFKFKQELRHFLSGNLGMHELLTYSFVSRDLLEKVGQDVADSYEIVNSISPELQCFRQQIVPSLLDKVRENIKSGHKDFAIYELNQVSAHSFGLTEDGTPVLKTNLGIVTLGDFYQLKSQILALTRRGLKITLEYSRLTPAQAKSYPYLEPACSAAILVNGAVVGAFGEVRASALRRFKLDQAISAAEICLDSIIDLPRTLASQLKISKFPFVERDLTLKVSADAEFGRFYAAIDEILENSSLIFETTPVSIYQASPDDPTKNISFHLKFSSPSETLDQAAISAIMEKVTVATTKLGASVV